MKKKDGIKVNLKNVSFAILKDNVQVKVKGRRTKHVVVPISPRKFSTFITISNHRKRNSDGTLQASIPDTIPSITCRFQNTKRILSQEISDETMIGMMLAFMIKNEISDISFDLDGKLTIATKKGFDYELLRNLGKTV